MKIYELNGKFYNSSEIQKYLNPNLDQATNQKNRISKVLKIFDKEFDSILDIGAHLGNFLSLVEQINPSANKLYGIDCYEPSVKICKDFIEDDKKKFFLHDCGKLNFEDKSFDVVTFFEVLEHVRNLNDFLKEVNRVLKDNGKIYLSVPNATWWRNISKDIVLNSNQYAKTMEKWPFFTPDQRDHVNNFNFIHLYRILYLNGFKMEALDYYDQSNLFIFEWPYFKKLSSTMLIKLKKEKDV